MDREARLRTRSQRERLTLKRCYGIPACKPEKTKMKVQRHVQVNKMEDRNKSVAYSDCPQHS